MANKKMEIYESMASLINSKRGNLDEQAQAQYNELEQRFLAECKAEETEKRFDKISTEMRAVTEQRAIATGVSTKVADEEIRSAFFNYVRTGDATELRNMNSYSTAEGGAVVPTTLYNQIATVVAGLNVVRQLPGINVIATNNNTDLPFAGKTSIGYVLQSGSGSYGDLASTFSKATLKAHKFGGVAKVSEELLNDSGVDLASFLATRLGTDLAEFEEAQFLTGAGGANAMTGLTVVTPTATDVVVPTGSFSAVGSAPVGDALLDAYFSLSAAHAANAVWVVGQDLLKLMMKARSGEGDYLFDVTGMSGVPTFAGRPVYLSSALPATGAAAGTAIGLLVDPRVVVIGDRTNLTLRRLNERYADEGNVGFLVSKRSDIAVTNLAGIVQLLKQ